LQSGTGITVTNFTFTGLAACEKYYYRVRGITCDGASEWVENQNRHSISVHLKGGHTQQAIQFDEKITDLIVTNVFSMITGVSFRYSNGATEPNDWTLFPSLSIADLQNSIDNGGSDFWVLVEATGFATEIQEGVIIFEYTSETFYLSVCCLDYETPSAGGVTKDILICMRSDRKFKLQNVTASAGTTFYYGLRTSANSDYTEFGSTTIAGLNTQIQQFANATNDLLIAIHAVPDDVNVRTVNLFVNYL